MQALRQGYKLQGGKYTIGHELGRGSFGITYLAHMEVIIGGSLGNTHTKVNVAIKEFFMREMNTRKEGSAVVEGSSSELVRNYRRKFRTEAENLSRMQHPSIVKVLDVFDENGTTYYVMEYIEGQSLDDFVCRINGLSPKEALGIVRQIADAVGYMHRHKMLHLDIKPKNVMMDSTGKAYLIDFGLSKQYTDDGRPESSTTLGLGTPGYAPMEQASYKPDGSFPATLDIYALGATLYKMLTGKTPPDSPTVFNDGLDRLPMMTHNVPSWLQDTVEKTMSPGRRQRPQTVEEFMAMLKDAQYNTARSVTKSIPDDEMTVIEGLVQGEGRKLTTKMKVNPTTKTKPKNAKVNMTFSEKKAKFLKYFIFALLLIIMLMGGMKYIDEHILFTQYSIVITILSILIAGLLRYWCEDDKDDDFAISFENLMVLTFAETIQLLTASFIILCIIGVILNIVPKDTEDNIMSFFALNGNDSNLFSLLLLPITLPSYLCIIIDILFDFVWYINYNK